MTTFFETESTCAVCGSNVETQECGSCTTRGSMMDGRILFAGGDPRYVTVCPVCGYRAWDIEANIGVTREELDSEEYRGIEDDLPAAAYLLSLHGCYEDAAWTHLHSAWRCDDCGMVEESREMRGKALQEFLKIADPSPTHMLVISDILRNLSRFDEASSWVDRLEKSEEFEPGSLPVNCEKRLIAERCDTPAIARWD